MTGWVELGRCIIERERGMEGVVYRRMAYTPDLYDYGAPVLKKERGRHRR